MDRPAWSYKINLRSSLTIVVIVWLVLATFTVLAPANQAISRYGISLTQGNLVRATVLVPQLLIWLAAVFAYTRFKNYFRLVAASAESKGFQYMTRGLFMLLLVLIIPSFINLFSAYHPESFLAQKTSMVLRNYVTIIFYFTAFWYLLQGARNLNKTIERPNVPTNRFYSGVIAAMVILITTYVWAIFHNHFRTVSLDPLIRPTYYLSDWLIVLTVLIPYIVVWSLGVLAIMELRTFARNVPGTVYRRAFLLMTQGLTVTVGLLIALQLISQAAQVFSNASLKIILLIVYLILLVIGIGYLLMARGARTLTKIEQA